MNARQIDTATECVVSLSAEEIARIHGAARLHIARGLLWLTVDGHIDDHMLRAGEGYTLGRGERAWLQAVGTPANVVIVDATLSWPQRVLTTLQSVTQRFAGVLL